MGQHITRSLFAHIDDGSAVVGENLRKTLGNGPMEFKVFDHVNIHVKRNTIYGLLGASGCGKTTLLKCLLGLVPVDYGEIWILGGRPNTQESGVPGFQVGYMPQDISLMPEHTVKEAVRYFGGLAGKTKAQVDGKYRFFSELVGLPRSSLRVGTLSEGDQRKVSLVCALIHEPDLLILDEPTSGLEPRTRERIWAYLTQITSVERRATVMITTHYIEEATGAHRIGILRHAKMIAEESPQVLIRRHRLASLEETVVLLSHQQDGTMDEMPVYLSPPEQDNEGEDTPKSAPTTPTTRSVMFTGGTTRPKHYLQLRFYNICHKNLVRLIRNPKPTLYSLVFPVIIISLLRLIMSTNTPSKFAIYNEDIENFEKEQGLNSLRSKMLQPSHAVQGSRESNEIPRKALRPSIHLLQNSTTADIHPLNVQLQDHVSADSIGRDIEVNNGRGMGLTKYNQETKTPTKPETRTHFKLNETPRSTATTTYRETRNHLKLNETPGNHLKLNETPGNHLKSDETPGNHLKLRTQPRVVDNGEHIGLRLASGEVLGIRKQSNVTSLVNSSRKTTMMDVLTEAAEAEDTARTAHFSTQREWTSTDNQTQTPDGRTMRDLMISSRDEALTNVSLAATNDSLVANATDKIESGMPFNDVSPVKLSTKSINGDDLAENSHRIKRSTGRLFHKTRPTPGYHEERISELVKNRRGVALPNITCDDIARTQGAHGQKVPLSCVFLSTLQEMDKDIQLHYFQDAEKVRQAAERGGYRGYFLIYKNYTPTMEQRFRGVSSMLTPQSPVYVALDMSDPKIGELMQQKLTKAQRHAAEKTHRLLAPDTDARYFTPPISITLLNSSAAQSRQAMSGQALRDDYIPQDDINFVLPGVMIVMTFFLQSGLTSGSIILERNTGLWERNSVAGVTNVEIVASHLLVMSVVACLHSAIVMLTVYGAFAVTCHGSLLAVFLILLLQAIIGETFGLLCSVFSRSITEVNFINLGLYYPLIHLCCVVEPSQAVGPVRTPLSYLLPLTPAIKALRRIQSGKGFNTYGLGLVSSFVWIALFLVAIFASLRFRR